LQVVYIVAKEGGIAGVGLQAEVIADAEGWHGWDAHDTKWHRGGDF
jgi:hypothetical protein